MKDTETPRNLKGKEFETFILKSSDYYRTELEADISRYGVQAAVLRTNTDGTVVARLMRSLPDFEGPLGKGGRQVIFDAKVCSAASFNLAKYREKGARSRQLRHMRRRSRFGAHCFFLIHWNERALVKSTVPAITYVFPVMDNTFWAMFDHGEKKAITRGDCESFGVAVKWCTKERGTVSLPMFLAYV